MLRTIKLYGHLRKKFGKLHHFAIQSPMEAIRALGANFKDFRTEFAKGDYAILVDGEDIPLDRLNFQGGGTIKIIPVAAGAGGNNGWTNILAGVAIIAISYFTFGAGAVVASWANASMATTLYGMGASMIFTGVSNLLTKMPALTALGESPNNQPSLSFNGPVNTYAQGQPVPIGYGELMIGSSVISASIVANAASTGNSPIIPCGGGILGSLYVNTPTGSALANGFNIRNPITFYDADNGDFTGVAGQCEWSGNVKGTTVELTFVDVVGSVRIAFDTDLYQSDTFTTIQAKDVTAGTKLAKAEGGYLEVATKTDGGIATLRQLTADWFAEHETGLLFRCYRTGNNDDTLS